MRTGTLIAANLVAVLAAFALAASTASACGVERWPVKTMTDGRAKLVKLTPRNTSVDWLRSRQVVRDPKGFRASGVERQVFRVRAALVSAKVEDDGDVHLVIASRSDPTHTMIVEMPSDACIAHARARKRISAARRAFVSACGLPGTSSFVTLSGSAAIEGVGFFDFLHGQRGVAPNGIELHPLTRFASANCATR